MNRIWMIAALAVSALLVGCDDTVQAWQLENDRIIAVRATPPQLAPGERATLDLLVTAAGRGPFVTSPQIAIAVPADPNAVVPDSLSRAVAPQGGAWTVVAPDAATLATLRASLGLPAGAPVPLRIGVRVDLGSGPLDAVKTVTFGEHGANPGLGAVTIGGVAAKDGLVIDADTDVELQVEAAPTDQVFWLTSIGKLSDFEDPVATLRHERSGDDLLTGQIAVVVRDGVGGVTWGTWTASVAP